MDPPVVLCPSHVRIETRLGVLVAPQIGSTTLQLSPSQVFTKEMQP